MCDDDVSVCGRLVLLFFLTLHNINIECWNISVNQADVPCANRVLKMARMFEALAEAELSGVRTATATRRNSNESGEGSDNEPNDDVKDEHNDDDDGDADEEQFADAERCVVFINTID